MIQFICRVLGIQCPHSSHGCPPPVFHRLEGRRVSVPGRLPREPEALANSAYIMVQVIRSAIDGCTFGKRIPHSGEAP